MERQYVLDNTRERERLRKLVNKITDKELSLIVYKEGWTVAVAFTHLAFWDERRRLVLKLWKQNGVTPTPQIGDMVNDVLIPLFLAIPPRKAAELSIQTAEALDREIEALSPEMITAIEALKEPNSLNRGMHRKMHLDEIETLLKAKRGKK